MIARALTEYNKIQGFTQGNLGRSNPDGYIFWQNYFRCYRNVAKKWYDSNATLQVGYLCPFCGESKSKKEEEHYNGKLSERGGRKAKGSKTDAPVMTAQLLCSP